MSVAVLEVTRSWWSAIIERMRATGCGKAAWIVFAVAIVTHIGVVPGASGVWAHEAINYDDPQVIHAVTSKSVTEILTEPTYLAYKPIYFLSLKIDAFFDSDLAGFSHMVNLLLHAWVALLLVLLIGDIFRTPWVALAVGLLFAVHPVHVESVAWLSERKDTLSLLFALWAHWSYRTRRERGAGALLVPAIWLLLGGLTKGTVWTYVGVIAIDEWMWRKNRTAEDAGGSSLVRLLPLLGVAVLGIGLDLYMGATQGPGAVEHDASFMQLVAAMAGVLFGYVQHLFVPLGLSLDYAIDPAGSFGSVTSLLGAGILLGSIAAFVWALRSGRTVVAMALAFWLFGLAPVNNVIPKTAVLMADRYLYIPAIGFYLGVAFLLLQVPKARNLILGVLVVAFGVLAVDRTRDFKDSEAVWSAAIDATPGSALAHTQRAIERVRRQAHKGALEDVARGIENAERLRRPEIGIRARLVRCKVYEEQAQDLAALSRPDESREMWETLLEEATQVRERLLALERPPQESGGLEAEAWIFTGRGNEALGLSVRALEAFRRAVDLDPENGLAQYDYATALAHLGSPEAYAESESRLKRALDLLATGPLHELASIQLATVLGKQRRGGEGVKVLQRAMDRYGRNARLLYALATLYLAEGGAQSIPKVKVLLNEIRATDRDHPKAARLQADIYLAEGRALLSKLKTTQDTSYLTKAIERFDLALEADKSYWDAHVAAGDALFERGLFTEARARYEEALSLEPRARWIDGLVVHSLVRESALMSREDPELWGDEHPHDRAARLMARALDRDVPRLDAGFVPLGEERLLLRKIAEAWRTSEGVNRIAARDVLRATASLLTGAYRDAREHIGAVLKTFAGSPDANLMVDGALLLRGLYRWRTADLDGARNDFALLQRRLTDLRVLAELKALQVDLRIASANLTIAQGFKDEEPKRLAEAQQTVARLWDVARDLATAYPESIGAGLMAAQADMQSQEWSRALRRLNELEKKHPQHPAIYRGRNAIYIQQRVVTPDEDMQRRYIMQASRELQKALSLDPRNVRTYLDSASLAQTAQDWNSALRHARKAFELQGRGGEAAQKLATYLVMRGRQARDSGQVPIARKYIAEAKQVDPSNPAPFVLEGEMVLVSTEKERLEKALDLGRAAYELAPTDGQVQVFLGDVHYQLGTQATLRIGAMQRPIRPFEDERWESATPQERGKMIKDWETAGKTYDRRVREHRDDALTYYESALSYYPPTHERVADLKSRIDSLRNNRSRTDMARMQEIEALLKEADKAHAAWRKLRSEADAERQRFATAQAAWAKENPSEPYPGTLDEYGDLMSRARQTALASFEDYKGVIALHPRLRRAHIRLVELAWALLPIWDRKNEKEKAMSDDVLRSAFLSLHQLDQLDPTGGLPERHLYRGLLNAHLYLRDQSEEARVPAERNLERYLERLDAMRTPRRGDDLRRRLAEAFLTRVAR